MLFEKTIINSMLEIINGEETLPDCGADHLSGQRGKFNLMTKTVHMKTLCNCLLGYLPSELPAADAHTPP